MGYRSDVRISTTNEGWEFFQKAIDSKNELGLSDHPLVGVDVYGNEHDFDYQNAP